jgi:hypothetical protein
MTTAPVLPEPPRAGRPAPVFPPTPRPVAPDLARGMLLLGSLHERRMD